MSRAIGKPETTMLPLGILTYLPFVQAPFQVQVLFVPLTLMGKSMYKNNEDIENSYI